MMCERCGVKQKHQIGSFSGPKVIFAWPSCVIGGRSWRLALALVTAIMWFIFKLAMQSKKPPFIKKERATKRSCVREPLSKPQASALARARQSSGCPVSHERFLQSLVTCLLQGGTFHASTRKSSSLAKAERALVTTTSQVAMAGLFFQHRQLQQEHYHWQCK